MTEIKKIGVIGEGKMGTSIILFLNGFNFELIWLCSSDFESDKAQKLFDRKTKLLFQCGAISEEEYVIKTESSKITSLINDLSDCDLVIEAINEDIELKRNLFKSLDVIVKKESIFTSNSSSIIPSFITPSVSRKDKFCGLHFFFPVAIKNIVELITNSSTSSETKELLINFISQINKKPFQQNEEHAFILNRLFLDFQAGAYNIFLEGKLSFKEIDDIVKEHLFPIGVFEFFDHVGIDTMLSSVKTYTRNSENPEFYVPLISKMNEMVAAGKLGIKTKSGFYSYEKPQTEVYFSKTNETFYKETKDDVLKKLKSYFLDSVNNVIDLNLYTAGELSFAVKDYMGIDYDPFPLNT